LGVIKKKIKKSLGKRQIGKDEESPSMLFSVGKVGTVEISPLKIEKGNRLLKKNRHLIVYRGSRDQGVSRA